MTKLCILLLMIFLASGLVGEVLDDDFTNKYGDRKVINITVSGLRRTSEKTFINWCEIEPGKKVSEYNYSAIIKNIEDVGLFAIDKTIKFYPTENDAVMYIEVQEKWSLIPMPFFSSNGDKSSYGGALIDSNVMGSGNMFIGALAVGSSSIATFGMFTVKDLWKKKYSAQFLFSYRGSDTEMTNIEEETHLNNRSFFASGAVIIKRKFLDKKLKIGPMLGYEKIDVDLDWNETMGQTPDSEFMTTGMVLDYADNNQYHVFKTGWKVKSKALYNFSLFSNQDSYYNQDFSASFSQMITSKANLSLHAHGGIADKPDLMEDRITGHFGAKSLPANNIYGDDWVDGAIVVEYPLLMGYKLNPTISAFYEGGYYDNDSLNEKYHGIGTEFRVYFDKVALPAMGFSVSYNLTSEQLYYNFSVGMGDM